MFASADLSKRSWLNNPVTKSDKVKKSKVTKIKWPIFDEMFKRESDPFWKDYWSRASQGKFPSGFSFNGSEVYYTRRNKCTRVVINDNIVEMCQVIKAAMQEHANIYSPSDLKRLNNILNLDDNVHDIESWSKCNGTKKDIIAHYLLELGEEYKLNSKEREELDQTINVGVNIGAFNKKTIIMSNNKIVYIEGLDWDTEQKKFYINTQKSPFKIKKPTSNASKKSNPRCFVSKWAKMNESKNKKEVTEMDINNINTSMSSCYPEE